jgi:hypothetical protein
MDKVGILCEKDRDMMFEFSRRSLGRIGNQSLLLGVLPFFSTYIDSNVKKEVDKDRLIIEEAASAYASGKPLCDMDLEDIFDKTKSIDRVFLNRLPLSSSFVVCYSDFADIRIQRIWRISKTVYALLKNWPDTVSFTDAVRQAYTGNTFKGIIAEILHLYNQETRMLGKSLRLLPPFNRAAQKCTETLFQAMEEVTEDIAEQYARKIFGDRKVYA